MTAPRGATVTILFTDLVNSTELLQRAGDEHAQRIFQAHHGLLREAAAAHRGHEVKWLGDGLMVAFSSAADAARCAIAMQQTSRQQQGGERLQIRVGLNVGETFTDESDYFGTPVVVARRLCDRAQGGQILASAVVPTLLAGRTEFSFDDLGPMQLKGIAAPAAACELRYEIDTLSLLAEAPFVGRLTETETLRLRLSEAQQGNANIVFLAGEPGIGKTRLCQELARTAQAGGCDVIWGHCFEGEWTPPFAPFAEVVDVIGQASAGSSVSAAIAANAASLSRFVQSLAPTAPSHRTDTISEDEQRFRFMSAVADVLSAQASERPLLLFLEDLHWADAGTAALLRYIGRKLAATRVMIVGTYRDAEAAKDHPLVSAMADLRREAKCDRIALEGLDGEAITDLLVTISEQEVPAAFVDAIRAETEGNPFFIREVLSHLIEEGKITRDDGRWITSVDIADLGIPDSVRDVIGRRLARLGGDTRRLLTVASAMTGGVSWEALRAIAGLPEASLLDALDQALESRLFVERSAGRISTYDFTHALVRHTLYEALSTPRRIALHRQIASALDALYGTDTGPHVSELAHHFYHAAADGGDAAKALDYCERAGRHALEGGAYEVAIRHLTRALELDPSAGGEHRVELMLALGRAQFGAGEIDTSYATFRDAGALAEEASRWDLLVRAATGDLRTWPGPAEYEVPYLERALQHLPKEGSTYTACGMAYLAYHNALSSVDPLVLTASATAEQLARNLADPKTLMYVLFVRHWTLAIIEPDQVETRFRIACELLELGETHGDRVIERAGHMWRFSDLIAMGDPSFEEDLAAYNGSSDEFRLPQYYYLSTVYTAGACLLRGEISEAERLVATAATFGINYRNQLMEGGLLIIARREQDRLREIEPFIRQAVAAGASLLLGRCLLIMFAAETDDLESCREEFDALAADDFDMLKHTGPVDTGAALAILGDACWRLQDAPRAEALYVWYLPFAGQNAIVNMTLSSGSADRQLGLMATLIERYDDAERHFEVALAMNTRLRARPALARTKLNYADMLARRAAPGDRERALELVEGALALAQEVGMPRVVADAEAVRNRIRASDHRRAHDIV